jgi:hypothetical protein
MFAYHDVVMRSVRWGYDFTAIDLNTIDGRMMNELTALNPCFTVADPEATCQ